MMSNNILERAELLLSNNKLLKALDLLDGLEIDQVRSEVVLLRPRLLEVKKSKNRGIISEDKWNLEVNKIRLAILELIKSIPRDQNINSENTDVFILLAELVNIIDTTFNTWQAQSKLKEKLLDALGARFELEEYATPYDLFADYYEKMNARELRLHKTIRGFTKNVIYPYNIRAMQLIKGNPSIKKIHQDIYYLEQHLNLWKSKYDSIFPDNESICLVFVGLEEGMKFPPNLLVELKEILEQVS